MENVKKVAFSIFNQIKYGFDQIYTHQRTFNASKCKCMLYILLTNKQTLYFQLYTTLNDHLLEVVDQIKDLEVNFFSQSLLAATRPDHLEESYI